MQYKTYDEMWADDVMDDDWPPKEPKTMDPSVTDKVNSFVAAVLCGAAGTSTFTCPICGHQAYRNIGRKCFAAKCEGCGMSLMS